MNIYTWKAPNGTWKAVSSTRFVHSTHGPTRRAAAAKLKGQMLAQAHRATQSAKIITLPHWTKIQEQLHVTEGLYHTTTDL